MVVAMEIVRQSAAQSGPARINAVIAAWLDGRGAGLAGYPGSASHADPSGLDGGHRGNIFQAE